nr:PREDICTED: facilitated trehalose transporter Tret1-like [Bemisia tabaci]
MSGNGKRQPVEKSFLGYPGDEVDRCKSTLSQFYATCVQCIFLISLGMQFVMPTIVLGALHNKAVINDAMYLDDADASWIGSTLYICHPIGSLISGFLSERFGRKGGMMLVNIPFIGGWVLLYCATSVRGLYVATLTMGLGMGFCEAPIAAYLGETSEPRLRSIFTTMTTAACNLGVLIELAIGSSLDWRTSTLVSSFVPVFSFVLFFTIPESPVWLITKGRMKDAQKSLAWLRGFAKPHQVQNEFDELVRYTKMSYALGNSQGNPEEKAPLDNKNNTSKHVEEDSDGWLKTRYKEITNPKLYMPLKFVMFSFFWAQCACLIPFRSYMIGILENFWFPVDRKWILIMTGVVAFIGSVVPMFIIQYTGKRKLGLSCMFVATASILCLGVFASFYTHTENLVVAWLLIVDLAVVHFVGFLGIINVSWMLVCEIFPVRARGIATGISTGWSCFIAFLLTKGFLWMESMVGLSGLFYMYGVLSFLGCIYYYFNLPETEGKTLERIETYFTSNHDKKEKYSMPSRSASKA